MIRAASGTRSRALRAALAVALCLAAGAASAQTPPFTRTTTCDTPSPPCVGNPLYWAGAPPTVTWTLYTGYFPPGCADLATLEALTAASFSTWSNRTSPTTGARSDFSFQHGAANRTTDAAFGNDGRNLVTWRHGLCRDIPAGDSCHGASTCQDIHNCWETGTIDPTGDVLALTWVTFQTNGQIVDTDLELNDWNGLATTATAAGYSYTCSAPISASVARCSCTTADGDKGGCTSASTSCVWADVGAIVTHEAGHVLGLDHPADPSCSSTCDETMAPMIGLGTTDKRVLSSEDVKGVTTIYPGGSTARQSGGCGCGGEPSAALWALLGPVLLWRRRR